MIVYIDTNVYANIARQRSWKQVRRVAERNRARVVVSFDNIAESARAPVEERAPRYRAIRALGDSYLSPPSSWLEAQQVLAEIRRCAPQWLKRSPDVREAHRILRQQKSLWRRFKEDTGFEPADVMPEFVRTFESAAKTSLAFQRQVRGIKGQSDVSSVLMEPDWHEGDSPETISQFRAQPPLERSLRISLLKMWWSALNGAPSVRDLRDWLAPYLDEEQIEGAAFERLWLEQVDPARLPIATWAHLIFMEQTGSKIQHGNQIDIAHGVNALWSDLFLTCDQAFFGALERATYRMSIRLPRMVLLNGGSTNIATDIEIALETSKGQD